MSTGIIKSKNGNSPQIGFGTYNLNPETMAETIKKAIMGGYRLFDTASEYKNEDLLGDVIYESVKAGIVEREDLFIQTKFYPVTPYGERDVYEQFSNSIEQLRVDYVDSYLIHKPVPWHSEVAYRERNKDVWQAFKKLKAEGKVRYIGVSNFLERHIDFLDEKEEPPEINQIEIHPEFQQRGLCEWCRDRGIIIQAWSPLSQGKVFSNDVIRELAKKYNKSEAQICLRWSVQCGNIPITSTEDSVLMKENMEILDFQIEDEDMNRFMEINTDDKHWDLWLYKRRSMY